MDKGRSLALVAALYGVPLEQCAAVGDSDNDLAALRAAGLSIAMGNAPKNVKDAAARIAPLQRGGRRGLGCFELSGMRRGRCWRRLPFSSPAGQAGGLLKSGKRAYGVGKPYCQKELEMLY